MEERFEFSKHLSSGGPMGGDAPFNKNPQELNSSKPFWIVYVEGHPPPTFIHSVRENAVREAIQIASKTKKTVYLMKSIEGFKIHESPVERFNLS